MPTDPTADASSARRREARRAELARCTKRQLIARLQPHVMTAHPLSTWTKEEIISSLLDREFRADAAGDAG